MIEEQWKDIKGYEGAYQVSNFGRVRSLDRYVNCGIRNNDKVLKKGKIIKQNISNNYLVVGLCNGKTQKSKLVHRLVAEAFILNPNNYPCVNHKNENKLNNCWYNLEWCTNKYNNNYGTRLTRISEKLQNNKKLSKAVNQYDLNNNFIKKWNSAKQVERELGISNAHINKCCQNKEHYRTSGGYIWKYAEEE